MRYMRSNNKFKDMDYFQILDYIFFGVYASEALGKIISLGFEEYFDDSWNNFDFFLVMFQLIFEFLLINIMSETLI
jgi:hypothetical protein